MNSDNVRLLLLVGMMATAMSSGWAIMNPRPYLGFILLGVSLTLLVLAFWQ